MIIGVRPFKILVRDSTAKKNILRECSLCTYATDEARIPCSYHRPALRRNTRTAGTSPLRAIVVYYISLYAFSRYVFMKKKLTFGIREHVVYAGVPQKMICFRPVSPVSVIFHRRYRGLIPRADVDPRRWAVISLRVVRTEVRVSLVLM